MKIEEWLSGVKTIGISGHIRPDGDCVGSCMGLYLYLKKNYPEIHATVFLEEIPEEEISPMNVMAQDIQDLLDPEPSLDDEE